MAKKDPSGHTIYAYPPFWVFVDSLVVVNVDPFRMSFEEEQSVREA